MRAAHRTLFGCLAVGVGLLLMAAGQPSTSGDETTRITSLDPPVASAPGAPPTAVVHGLVLDASGGPLAGCWIDRAGPGPMTEQAVVSDDRGRFEVGVWLGHWVMTANCRDGRSGTVTLEVRTTDGAVFTIRVR